MINGGLLCLFLTKLLLGKKKSLQIFHTEGEELGWRNIKMMVAIETAIETGEKRERKPDFSQRDEMNSLSFLRHQKKYEAFFDAYGMSLQSTD